MGDGKTAFVLAGGGTKGAFEAGALSYLVEEEGLVPDVLTATSAGAICAAVLAQARTAEEMATRVAELRDDLLAMSHRDLLFGKQPWYAALDGTPAGRAIDHYLIERSRPPLPEGAPVPVAPSSARPWARRWDAAASAARAAPNVVRARRAWRGNSGSVLTLEPLAAALRGNVDVGIKEIDPALIARRGLQLRMAVVALGAGVLRFVTEDGTIVASDAVTPLEGAGGGPITVLDGMLASASVPLVFPPRKMADDVYVDGGVANNIPVSAAARLGATQIIAVLAVPLVMPPDARDYTTANGAAVFLRSVGAIAFAERQQANLDCALAPGATLTVIDPIVDVVGAFEVSQGLMLADMDYGWMRAADVRADLDEDRRSQAASATDAAVKARALAWYREEAIWAAGRANRGDLRALAQAKQTVRDAVTERAKLGLPTPTGAEQWWSGYEAHYGARPVGLPDDPSAD